MPSSEASSAKWYSAARRAKSRCLMVSDASTLSAAARQEQPLGEERQAVLHERAAEERAARLVDERRPSSTEQADQRDQPRRSRRSVLGAAA